MSEFKFACPSCQQRIAADASWVGQQIACPACNGQITVPAAPTGAGPQPVGRLSVTPHAPTPPAPKTSMETMAATHAANRAKAAPASNAGKNAAIAIVSVVLLGGIGYGAFKYFGSKHETASDAKPAVSSNTVEAAAQQATAKVTEAPASSVAATPAPSSTNSSSTPAMSPANRRAVSEAEARYGKNSITVEPLDDSAAPDPSLIPDKPVAGTVQNEPFKISKVTFERGWLTLGEGTGAIPDKSVKLNLYVPATESIEGRTFKRPDSKERRPLSVQPKTKRMSTSTTTGFQLQLEFGKKQGSSIPGKIYLSIPGTVTNMITGTFTAEMK